MAVDNTLNIDINIQAQGSQKTISQVKKINKEFNTLDKVIKDLYKSEIKSLSTKEKLIKATKVETESIKKLNKISQQYIKTTLKSVPVINKYNETIGRNINKIITVNDGLGNTITHTERVSSSMTNASSQWLLGSKTLDKLNDRLNAVRWTMVNVTFAFAGVAALIAPLALLVKGGAEWELQLKRIQAVTADASFNTRTFSDELIKLREDNPITRGELAEGMLEFVRAGFSTNEALKAMNDVMNLSIAGELEMAKASEIVTSTLHAFATEGITTAEIVNVITDAADKSALEIEDFGNAMSFVAPIAASMGISFKEAAAALSVLANAGLRGSKSGTTLRQVLNGLRGASKEAETLMGKYGLGLVRNADDTVNLSNTLSLLKTAMDDLPVVEQTELMGKLFQIRGETGAQSFLNYIKSTDKALSDVTNNLNTTNAALKKAEILKSAKINKATSAVNDLTDSFADLMLEVNNIVTPFVTAMINMTTSVFNLRRELKDLGSDISTTSNLDELWFKVNDTPSILGSGGQLDFGGPAITNIMKAPQVSSVFNAIAKARPKSEDSEFDAVKEMLKKQRSSFIKLYNEFYEDIALAVEPPQIQGLLNIKKDLLSLSEKNAVMTESEKKSISGLIAKIDSQVTIANELDSAIRSNQVSYEDAKKIVASYKREISSINSELSNLNKKLGEVNKTIGNLSKPRFIGQLDVEKLIGDYGRWIKKQKLASMGIVDVKGFLSDMVKTGINGFEGLASSIKKVTDLTSNSKDSYEAWRETVKEFIRDAISQGNALATNVSGAVRKYSTLLLQTSKFGTETSKQDEVVSTLRDAYDVYYGDMTDNVSNAVKAHNEAANGIFTSSDEVITALTNQWISQTKLNDSISTATKELDILKTSLDTSQTDMNNFAINISSATTEMDGLIEAVQRLIIEQEKLSSVSISNLIGFGDEPSVNRSIGAGVRNKPTNIPFTPITAPFFDKKPSYFNDFIARPGQPISNFSPQDTIIGVKKLSDLMGGNTITISNLTINGANGDPEDFAFKFAQALKKETRTR